jgi:plastocyanin
VRKLIVVGFALLTIGLLLSGCRPTEEAEREPTRTSDIRIESNAYVPEHATVEAGSRVTWINRDSVDHTVTADDGDFDSGNLKRGESFSEAFEDAGTFDYHCSIHPNIRGTITVE